MLLITIKVKIMYTKYKAHAPSIPCYKDRIALLRQLALQHAQKPNPLVKVAK
jgi:hypothetical protein